MLDQISRSKRKYKQELGRRMCHLQQTVLACSVLAHAGYTKVFPLSVQLL